MFTCIKTNVSANNLFHILKDVAKVLAVERKRRNQRSQWLIRFLTNYSESGLLGFRRGEITFDGATGLSLAGCMVVEWL